MGFFGALIGGIGGFLVGGPFGAAAGAAAGYGTGEAVSDLWDYINADPVIGKSICVLGMQESGKTQLYATMKGVSYSEYTATSYDEYDSFKFSLKGRTIEVAKGTDIGGGPEYVKANYRKMISENDIIFFVFDVNRFLNDDQYFTDTCTRLDFLNENLISLGKNQSSHYAVFGSHLDVSGLSSAEAATKVRQKLQYKYYASLVQNNFVTIDLRSKSEVFKFLDMIIK